MAMANLALIGLLAGDIFATRKKKLAHLHQFAPGAHPDGWSTLVAGQRAQIVKPGPRGRGILQFGTEVVTSTDGKIGGVLGASPGASVGASIALDLLQRCFTDRWASWQPTLSEYIPSLGRKLRDDPQLTQQIKQRTRTRLDLD